MLTYTQNSLQRSMQKNVLYGLYDPTTWITGSPTRGDNFTTLADGAALQNRTMSIGGVTWAADASWTGAGNGEIKCSTGAKGFANSLTHTNAKARVIWHPGAEGNNAITISLRNNDSNTYPRYGNLLKIYADGTVNLISTNNYADTILGTTTVQIYRGYNSAELRCVGTTITGYVNGHLAISLTDATWNMSRAYYGFVHHNRTNDQLRVTYVDMTLLA